MYEAEYSSPTQVEEKCPLLLNGLYLGFEGISAKIRQVRGLHFTPNANSATSLREIFELVRLSGFSVVNKFTTLHVVAQIFHLEKILNSSHAGN